MSRPRQPGGRIRGIHANVAGRRKVGAIKRQLKRGWADELWLTEGYRIVPWLRKVAPRHGYRVVALDPDVYGPEARDVVLVVRKRSDVVRHRPMRMKRSWRGLNVRRVRAARVYHRLVRRGVRGVGLHLPPFSRGRNTRSRNESMRRVSRRLDRWSRRRDVPAYAVGDWNLTAGQLRRALPGRWARVYSCRKVCHLVTVGCTGAVRRIKQPRGFHGWFKYVVKF